MTIFVTIEYTNRFDGMWTVKELMECNKQAYFTGDYKLERTAKAQVTRRMKLYTQYDHIEKMVLVTPEEMQAEVEKRNAQEDTTPEPVQDDEELSPEDITALEEALAQPDMGPFTMQELEQMVEQAQVQNNLIKFFQAAYEYCRTIQNDYLPQPHEWIYGSRYRPITASWARIPEAHYARLDRKDG